MAGSEYAELCVKQLMAQEALNEEKAKVNRFLRALKMYEDDMDFDCTTDLEKNLKEQMLDIFKMAHALKEEL